MPPPNNPQASPLESNSSSAPGEYASSSPSGSSSLNSPSSSSSSQSMPSPSPTGSDLGPSRVAKSMEDKSITNRHRNLGSNGGLILKKKSAKNKEETPSREKLKVYLIGKRF